MHAKADFSPLLIRGLVFQKLSEISENKIMPDSYINGEGTVNSCLNKDCPQWEAFKKNDPFLAVLFWNYFFKASDPPPS